MPSPHTHGHLSASRRWAGWLARGTRYLYRSLGVNLYSCGMDVAVTELRAHLSDWLARADAGEEIVVTERGMPVARLIGLRTRTALERLTDEGVIARPIKPHRPTVKGRQRPRPRRPVAEVISEQRR